VTDPLTQYINLNRDRERREKWRESIKDALFITVMITMVFVVWRSDSRSAEQARVHQYEGCTSQLFDLREAHFEEELVTLLAVLLDEQGELPAEIREGLPTAGVALLNLFQAGQQPSADEILEACGLDPEAEH
jgi:hypothetical protein